MKITLKEIKKNTAYVNASLSESEVLSEKEHAVDELISTVTVKGFRQGKAPKTIAQEYIDPDKLSNHILGHVLNDIVLQTLKENKLRLLGRPVLEKIDSKKTNGWAIELTLPLFPEVKIDTYKKILPTPKKTKKEESKEEKIDRIYDILLEKIKFDVPESVITEETNLSLEKLESQAKSLNLTLEGYLSAVKKSLDQVKAEYAKKAEESIKLDLILLEIAKKEKIDTPLNEVVEVAKAGGVPENQYGQLKNILDRRKTIELLLKLC